MCIRDSKERDYERADNSAIENFKNILERNQITATVRRSMGRDIDAACGQQMCIRDRLWG